MVWERVHAVRMYGVIFETGLDQEKCVITGLTTCLQERMGAL